MTMIGDTVAGIIVGLALAWTLLNVGALIWIVFGGIVRWPHNPMDWRGVMRAGLAWACMAGAALAYQALAYGAVDEVATWIVLIGLGVAALGWYMHDRARMAWWRFMTGRDGTPGEDRNGTEIR